MLHTGSPPRGRGKVCSGRGFDANIGITPAWAGKSLSRPPAGGLGWDHPRVGGEKHHPTPSNAVLRGSPPRGRGKVPPALTLFPGHGITPAWAGKSCKTWLRFARCGDHPRVGGEKQCYRMRFWLCIGSPPRGRGKALAENALRQHFRITPAWAGKRLRPCGVGGTHEDHPRVGGEKAPSIIYNPTYQGSPPRGRGKERGTDEIKPCSRITPAWAGKRLKRSHRSGIFISGPIPFHSVLHRPAGSGGSRAGRDGSPAGQPQNTGPA